MARVPKGEPLFNIDHIGRSGVGTALETPSVGSPWEMGVAVPIKNRKFERGTLLEYTVGIDSFDRPGVERDDSQFGIGAVNQNQFNTPSNYVQYGDKAFLGPSTHPGFPNHSEYIQIAAVGEVLSSLTNWVRGEVFPLTRANKFEYLAGNRVTIYGTGCGDNWVPRDNQLLTLGTQKGITSLNRRGFYLPQIGDISSFEASVDDLALAFQIRLPSHSAYTSDSESGDHSRAWGHLGLLPFRSADHFSGDGMDWFYEQGDNSGVFRFMLSKNTDENARALYTTDTGLQYSQYVIRVSGGVNAYLIKAGTDSRAQIGDIISTSVKSSRLNFRMFSQQLPSLTIPDVTISDGANEVTISFGGDTVGDYLDDPLGFAQVIADAINAESSFILEAVVPSLQPAGYPFYIILQRKGLTYGPTIDFEEEVKIPLILGFNHPGGQTTDFSQALLSIANANRPENIGILSQSIRPFSPQYPALITNTHYRLGITWKGSIKAEGATSANLEGSELFAAFRWNPLVAQGNVDHYANSMMSTPALLDEDHLEQEQWRTDLVTNYVDSTNLDSLSDIESNRVDIVLKSKGQSAYFDSSDGRGVELMAFVDQVWLEHQGGIPGGQNGCVRIDHYPNQATLAVNRRSIKEAEVLTMANGQQFNVSSVLTGDKRIYEIDADFLNVPLAIYDQFRALLRWQDRGYFLTLHPYLPGVPHCLVGRLEITNEQKNHWDLNRYTFHFKFIEQD